MASKKILGMKDVSQKKPKVIGVILAYNVAKMLPRALERIQSIPKGLLDDLILMDDGSKDGTYEAAKKLGLKAFRHVPNKGYGGNLKEGIKRALEMGADYIVEIHGDGAQFNPISIKYAMPFMQKGHAQLILGSRFQKKGQALKDGMPLIRFLANRGLSFFDRLVLGLKLTEFHTGFRIYGRKLLEKVPYDSNTNDYLFSFQIIAQAAYYKMPVGEVLVEADYHSDHTSHSIKGASWYAIRTFGVLTQFILAKAGIAYNKVFKRIK
ncbi:glycosyltransferase family 2 protein [Candidatus Pacearchaeota archaeon]|nr:glycosyltransferase family 2 protein [Candidatus Pacearchaeota archaeon]